MAKLNLQTLTETMPNPKTETDAIRSALRKTVQAWSRLLCGDPNRRMSSRLEWRFGSHGSLSIVIAGPKAGIWFDHEAGRGGDAFDLISLRLGLSFPQAKDWAGRFVLGTVGSTAVVQPATMLVAANDNRKEFAERIWCEASDPRGTVVETYLASRKLPIPGNIAGSVLRFHGALQREGCMVPGMVALMRDLRNNEPCGIHRTFLTSDGAKLDKKMLGRAKDAAMKLSADEHVTSGLHIGEGIETCMSWMRLGFEPVWALGSAGAIDRFPALAGIGSLTILMETDEASANAMAACCDRWLAAGNEVNTVLPIIEGDGNDVLIAVA
ncbi:DUF7146 domain-containing protein [Bradyrhizobium sp. 956_D2_N1_5]|uniref:DUF7146 domain-containing protein n=1 Tax=unclassified Bradyrhizobium TaxID=2631580 RepID=UPI003F2348E9